MNLILYNSYCSVASLERPMMQHFNIYLHILRSQNSTAYFHRYINSKWRLKEGEGLEESSRGSYENRINMNVKVNMNAGDNAGDVAMGKLRKNQVTVSMKAYISMPVVAIVSSDDEEEVVQVEVQDEV